MSISKKSMALRVASLYIERIVLANKKTSDFAEWSTGLWIHYSNEPYVKINPKPFHQDPSGIYLFPEKFESEGQWEKFRYKFICKIDSGMKILDLGKWNTHKKAMNLYNLLVPKELSDQSLEYFKKSENPIDSIWSHIRGYFIGHNAKFNKALRSLGYDAVFDDTDAIHVVEKQLLVLNPTKVKVVEMIDQKSKVGSGYKYLEKMTNYILNVVGPKYGETKLTKPIKERATLYQKPKLLSEIEITKGDKDAGLSLYIRKDKDIPVAVEISLIYSNPRLGYGSGATWAFNDSMEKSLKPLAKDLDKIFEKNLKDNKE